MGVLFGRHCVVTMRGGHRGKRFGKQNVSPGSKNSDNHENEKATLSVFKPVESQSSLSLNSISSVPSTASLTQASKHPYATFHPLSKIVNIFCQSFVFSDGV